ncbi:MAG: T9SS type A sorting domain-containing protein [bacterium]
MKIGVTILILFFGISSKAQSLTGEWSPRLVSADTVDEIYTLHFVDSLIGYLAIYRSDNPSIPVIGGSRLYRTLDGGANWSVITFNGLTDEAISNLKFYRISTPTRNSIYLKSVFTKSYIVWSLDNGLHWNSALSNLDDASYFSMLTEKDGIAISNPSSYPELLKTHDGCSTFIELQDSLFSSSLVANTAMSFVIGPQCAGWSDSVNWTFIVFDKNIRVGNGLTSLVTDNGGLAWKKYHTDFPRFPNDSIYGNIQYQIGSPNLWMMPWKDKLNGEPDITSLSYYRQHKNFKLSYAFSTDYGKSWDYDTSFFGKLGSFYALSPGNVWTTIIEPNSVNPPIHAYTIAHTTNFGTSWEVDSTSLLSGELGKFDARCIFFSDSDHGWIAALHNNHPYVLKYNHFRNSVRLNHGKTGRDKFPTYPLPASNSISISIPGYATATGVQIFDILGREFIAPYQIIDKQIKIDTHGLPDGIWLAVLMLNYGMNSNCFVVKH